MSGYVYAIKGSDGLIKIGHSRNPQRRLSKMRCDNQGNLRLLGCVPATLSQEAELHFLLSASLERGEWFRPSRLVQTAVAMMRPWPLRGFRGGMEPAATIIKRLGGPTAVAQIAGVHRTRVSNWTVHAPRAALEASFLIGTLGSFWTMRASTKSPWSQSISSRPARKLKGEEGMATKIRTARAPARKMRITLHEAPIAKGMLKRGDAQHDIAHWFGENSGRVAEINTGQRFADIEPAPEIELPPSGPYPSHADVWRARHALEDAIEELRTANRLQERALRIALKEFERALMCR